VEAAAAKLSTLGKYSLIASLGQGGMAKVYLALMAGPAGFNKLLVIKALREDMLSSSEEFVDMFLDEARLAARLSHPNIVQTYEVGESEGRYFIAMEYLEGQSLRTIQRRLSPQGLPLEEELRVISQTAHGLHYAHGLKGFNGEPLGVVHRDVSPQNVFLNYDGQVKLLDFGIAKTQDAEHLTKVGVIKGKIDYIAPEQIRGEKVDARADIFALGAMMWEAISGRRFAGGPKVADVTKIHTRVTGTEPKLREISPDVPDVLAQICERAIALNPDDRYLNALEFAEDIEKYLHSAGLKPTSKSLSELIAPPFEAEREKMRRLIDQQIQLATRRGGVPLGDTTGGLPRLGPNHTRTASGVRPDVDLTESGYLDLGADGSIPSIQTLKSMPPSAGAVAPIQPQQKPGVPKAAVIGILAAAVAVAAFFATQSDDSSAKAGSAPRPNTGSQATAAIDPSQQQQEPQQAPQQPMLQRVESVHVKIDVWPTNARVTLDGAILPRVPFDAEVTKDTAFHHLDVTAEGYAPVKQALQFDQNREVKIVLEREQAPVQQPSGPSRRNQRNNNSNNANNNASNNVSAPQPQPAPVAQPTPAPRVEDPTPGADLTTAPAPRRMRPTIDLDDPYNQK